MALEDLAVVVHEEIGAVAVQHARAAAGDRGGVAVRLVEPVAGGLDPEHLHPLVVEEGMEEADGVRPAADRRDEAVGQAALLLEHLRPRLGADDALEVAHHHRVGMRAGGGADAVERVGDIGHPVAQGLVHRVLERARAGLDRAHLRAQHLHAEHVRLLPLDVDCAHVDDAVEAEAGAGGRGRDAVLAGAGLGDDALLAHAAGEQDLAEHVVDLVRAGVVELVALEIDFCAAEPFGQPLGEIERARPPGIVLEEDDRARPGTSDRPSPPHRPSRARG